MKTKMKKCAEEKPAKSPKAAMKQEAKEGKQHLAAIKKAVLKGKKK